MRLLPSRPLAASCALTYGLIVIGAVATLLSPAASAADARWLQVPSHPVWVDLPAGWKAAADAKEPMLVVQGERGGTLFVLVVPTDTVTDALARLKRRLESEWREVKVVVGPTGRLTGSGRLAESRFTIDSRSRQLDTSGVSAVHNSLTLVVVSGLPKAARISLDDLVASARIRWERPGGGWVTVPGAGVQVLVPVDGWRRVNNADVLSLKATDTRSEVQLRVAVDETPASVIEQFQKAFAFFTWDAAPRKWTPAKGIGSGGLELSGSGDLEGRRFRAVLRAAVLPATEKGPVHVLFVVATSEGGLDPKAPDALPPPLTMAQLLEVSGALRPAP